MQDNELTKVGDQSIFEINLQNEETLDVLDSVLDFCLRLGFSVAPAR